MIDTKAIDFEVKREPLFTQDHRETRHDAIVRQDTGKVVSVVSRDYNLLPHRTAFEKAAKAVQGIGYGMEIKKLAVSASGSKMFLMLQGSQTYDLGGKDNMVQPTLILINSIDGTTKFGFKIGALRLICTNGMVRGIAFQNISIRHTSGADFSGIIEAGGEAMSRFNLEAIPRWQRMVTRHLDDKDIDATLLAMKSPKLQVPNKVNEAVLRKLRAEGAMTSWDLYNHYTNVLTHQYVGSPERRIFISGTVERVLGNL